MLKVITFILVAAALFAQTAPAQPDKPAGANSPQAPPEVNAALWARVTRFYQLQVEGKFNQALELVAEDTKDAFVGAGKSTPRGFEIQSVQYSADFTRAQVIVTISRLVPLEGFVGHPVAMKVPSRWKLENGQWCYYVDPRDARTNPFAPSTPRDTPPAALPPGIPVAGGVPPGMPSPTGVPPGMSLPGSNGGSGPAPANLQGARALRVDKLSAQLKSSGPSVDQVTIVNATPWDRVLTLSDPKVAGLTAKLDNKVVKQGGKVILEIRSNGESAPPKTPVTIVVTVGQTNQLIPIKVSFVD